VTQEAFMPSRYVLGRSLLACLAGALLATLGACKQKSNHEQLTAPAITTQPQGQSVLPGETATFTMEATGSAPLTYQWSKNGADIAGATSNSYTTPAAQESDDGATYRVTVSNDAGNVTSNPANLVVITPYWLYRDGVVADGWSPYVWHGCGTSNPNMTGSFAGQTVASFDTSCWHDGWDAGAFGYWSAPFDLSSYDTLSFDIGADSTAGMDKVVIWADAGNTLSIGPVVAGQLNHVRVPLSDLGLAGAKIQQLGFFYNDAGAGPLIYVTHIALSHQRPTTPPAISNLALAHAESYTATITWTTDRASAGVVTAQADGGPALTSGDRALGTTHSFMIESLQPGTLYHVSVVAKDAFGLSSTPATIDVTTAAAGSLTPDVTVTLDPAHPSAISPLIYGTNGLTDPSNPSLLTFDRSGGNRLTAYNWENNASNAGSDYKYQSDNYLSTSSLPGEVARSMIAADRAAGAASLVTFQLQGWVSADEAGPVDMTQDLATRLATRFKQVVPKKSTITTDAFTLTPPTDDAYVYMDEFAWALDQKFLGQNIFGAGTALPTFISLDNEPELWGDPTNGGTHEEIQGRTRVTSDAIIQKTLAMTSALKDQFPDVKIFGPVHYGFMGLWNWQDDATLGGGTSWFTDKYLKALKAAEDADPAHRRLVDVYDFHWYAEVYDSANTRVVDMGGADLTDEQIQLIVQSPRSLWDSTFDDPNNWIHGVIGAPIQILPRLQAKIDAEYPGTKLSVTEYESGGWNHIAGTVAQADNLGIFGAQGVFAANFWPPGGSHDYALAGFRAFRGFDGAAACFGDTSIPTTSSDVSKVAVYASQDSAAAGRKVFVAINRSTSIQKVSIAGAALSGTATLYRITAATAAAQANAGAHVAPVPVGTQAVSGTSMLVVLPPLSVTTIAVQ
jgi:hypothetical protein